MSALEHYREDFDAIDLEIKRTALTAGIDLRDAHRIAELLQTPHSVNGHNRLDARERLRGLIILRTKLETERLLDTL